MKKRLLALILCLVLATSLLPLSAAAYTDEQFASFVKGITHKGTYCGDTYFTLEFPRGKATITDESGITPTRDSNGRYMLPGGSGGKTYTINYLDENGTAASKDITVTILNHDWQFTKTENSLTATCRNRELYECSVGEVSLTLDAHSVTLPGSPFNAQVILNGITEEQIKEEFGYLISPIRYKFKAPGDSAFTEITPADGAREGTYQAAVTLSPKEVAARYARNDDGTTQGLVTEPDGSITLYTQYTAVNPETTAQTGDNRPIELMMGSVVLFSALAAAAFILDSKRRSQQ